MLAHAAKSPIIHCMSKKLIFITVLMLLGAALVQAQEKKVPRCTMAKSREFSWIACGPVLSVSPETNEFTILNEKAPPGFSLHLTFKIGWLSKLYVNNKNSSVACIKPGDYAQIDFFEVNENQWRVYIAQIDQTQPTQAPAPEHKP